jgi:hypothetical protein
LHRKLTKTHPDEGAKDPREATTLIETGSIGKNRYFKHLRKKKVIKKQKLFLSMNLISLR